MGHIHSIFAACMVIIIHSKYSSSSFRRSYIFFMGHKKKLGPRVYILLLPQATILHGSDAGSDGVKPATDFVIQNRQILFSMWCLMYGTRCYDVVCGLFSGAAPAIR